MRHVNAISPEMSGAPDGAAAIGRHREIAADLHDTVLQPLVSLVVSLEAMARRAPETDEIPSRLAVCESLAREALGALRAMLLTEVRAHPHVQVDLPSAIEQHLRPQLHRCGIQLHVQCQGRAPELPDHWLSQVYLIIREAVTNAEKHARASVVTIELAFADEVLSVIVADNGSGFTTPARGGEQPNPQGTQGSGLGLRCMRARVTSLGGALTLISTPGQGTRLMLHAPYPRPASPAGAWNCSPASIPAIPAGALSPALLSPEA